MARGVLFQARTPGRAAKSSNNYWQPSTLNTAQFTSYIGVTCVVEIALASRSLLRAVQHVCIRSLLGPQFIDLGWDPQPPITSTQW